jgi:cytochrome c-type biogenesis protein CcmE
VLDRRRFLVGGALIAVSLSYLVFYFTRATAMYYFELDEFLPRRAALAGEDLRVKGWVHEVTVDDPATNELRFALARQDGTDPVPVTYHGIKPDMFAPGREVVVEGRYDGATLSARQVMTSCPSKYEAQKDGA